MKRKVNRLYGKAAGFNGMHPAMAMALVPVGMISVGFGLATENMFFALGCFIVLFAAAHAILGKYPDEFLDKFASKPNWIRDDRQYINSWNLPLDENPRRCFTRNSSKSRSKQ